MAQPLHPPGGWRPHIQVLIAEDDPHVRSLVVDIVQDLGHAPSCAANGDDALAIYENEGADVVVSDWMMPGLNGAELCRRLRSHPGTPYTYFIMLTAFGDAEHRLAGMRAGADDYLGKPFSIDEIEARLIVTERVTLVHRRRGDRLPAAQHFADPRTALERAR